MKVYLFFLFFLNVFSLEAQIIQKDKLIYQNKFSNKAEIANWIMEGPGKIDFIDQEMHLYAENESGHHVFWCPIDFPANFIAEWDAKNLETDAGLCIIFFSAKGLKGESIFDTSLPQRNTGVFTDYTKGAMNCYHISYYANAKDDLHRETANLRKNKGFNLVQTGEKGIPIESNLWHHLKLVKDNGQIIMYVDERKIIDWLDDGKIFGPVLEDGKIGFRQMKWTHFVYKDLKIWSLK